MDKQAFLALADGSIHYGYAFGGQSDTFGEVVFCTSMIGYQEMLTDPSYAGQILITTYPLIGNYGVNEQDFESVRIQVRGFVVQEQCLEPSHYLSRETIRQYLEKNNTTGHLWPGYPCAYPPSAIARRDDGHDNLHKDPAGGFGRAT